MAAMRASQADDMKFEVRHSPLSRAAAHIPTQRKDSCAISSVDYSQSDALRRLTTRMGEWVKVNLEPTAATAGTKQVVDDTAALPADARRHPRQPRQHRRANTPRHPIPTPHPRRRRRG
jgi:hypothetical protein